MAARYPPVGTVLQVALPDGRFAYGRVLRDAAIAFYRRASTGPAKPPVGSGDFAFCVGVYREVVLRWERVGLDPFSADEGEGWPPASAVHDAISGSWRIYEHGEMRAATADEAQALEPAAVWDEQHLLPRLIGSVVNE